MKHANVIIVQGNLILHNEAIRRHIDIKIFIDSDEDVRLSRRVVRYLKWYENTVTLDEYLANYFRFTKPSYEQLIEPSKKYADIIIPNYGFDFEMASLGCTFSFVDL